MRHSTGSCGMRRALLLLAALLSCNKSFAERHLWCAEETLSTKKFWLQQNRLHADIEYAQYITPCGKCIARVVDRAADERETGVLRDLCLNHWR